MSNTFFNIVIGICSAIIALVTFGTELSQHFGKKLLGKVGFKVVATSIVFILGIWATVEKDISNDEKNDKDKIEVKKDRDALKADNASLKRSLEQAKSQIQSVVDSLGNEKKSLEEQNFKLSNALTETAFDLKKNIIGGEGPVYIDFGRASDSNGYCVLFNKSKLPINSLLIYISDYEKMVSCKTSPRKDMVVIDDPCYSSCTDESELNNVVPGPITLAGYALPKYSRGRLEIRFITKMGTEYLEQLVYIRLGLLIATKGRLYKLNGADYKFVREVGNNKASMTVDWAKGFKLPLKSRTQGPITWR